ncbi:MAG: IPT/TIG domain-containing protein [Myxococcales bacterium]|nr:IPT/TIG domain-containing protein [Myxococcales bacterium]
MAAWLWVAVPGCEDAQPEPTAPQIDAVRPAAAPAGAQVTVLGRRFGLRGPRDRAYLAGSEAVVESWSDEALLLRIPERAPGVADLVVRAGAQVSAPYLFEVLAPALENGVGVVSP